MLELMEHVACQASVWIDLATAKRRLEEKKLQLFEKRCNDIDDGRLLNGLIFFFRPTPCGFRQVVQQLSKTVAK